MPGEARGRAGAPAPGRGERLSGPAAHDQQKAFALTACSPGPDGQPSGPGLQEGGAELFTLRPITVATRAFCPVSIPAVFGGAVDWLPERGRDAN